MPSRTAAYALRAMVYLARTEQAGPVRVGELAEALTAPRNTLSKILGVLARDGILTSLRGPTGGFRLACRPEELDLARVVGLFDALPGRRCLLGGGGCDERDPCSAHGLWQEVTERVDAFFRRTTIADLAVSAGARATGDAANGGNRAGKPAASGRRGHTRREEAEHG